MTICKTAYDTMACNGFVLNKITDSLDIAHLNGQLGNVQGYSNIKTVEGGASVVDDVPSFVHPIVFEVNSSNFIIGVDLRNFGKWDKDQDVFRIRNVTEHALMLHRAKLNYVWLTEDTNILRDISQAPIALYASWISEAVSKRYALDPREQFTLAILSAIFYNSQFTNEQELSEREKLRLINTITKNLRASATDVMEVIDKVSVIHNVSDFCSYAETITGSIRLKELNVGVLYSLLAGTWYGTNSKELITVAIEHPPTWLTVLLYAFNERGYKNSQITKIAERNSFKNVGKDYVRALLNLIRIHGGNE